LVLLLDIRSRTFFLLVLAFLFLAFITYAKITVVPDNSFESYMQKISGNTSLDLLMQSFTELGWVVYTISIALILFIIKKTRRLGLILLLSLLIGTMSAAYMRCYTGYEKPDLQFMGAHLPFKSGADVGVPCAIDGTFPAEQTVRATIFALIVSYALSRRFPRGCYLLWLYPIAISISRLYLLQEYPTTVIAGAIFGFLIADMIAKKLKIEVIFEPSKT
jgi:undecaprenyl-diphosphatase